MAAPSFLVTNYAGATTTASDIIGLVEARLTAAGWVFVEEYAFTQTISGSVTTTSGSAVITVSSPSSIQNGYSVSGAGIPAGTYIVSGGNTASQTMSQAATATASGVAVAGSRAMRIWKNPSTLNAAGADFYIGLVKDTTGGPRLAVRAFEGWDTTTKTIQNPCIVGNSSVAANATTYAANVATNGVGTGSTSWSPSGTTTPLMVDSLPATLMLNNTNYDIGVLASKSYLVLTIGINGSLGSNIAAWVIGLFNPIWSDSQATYPPLMVNDLTNVTVTGNTTNGVSRTIRGSVSTPSNWGAISGPESILIGTVSAGSGLTREKNSNIVRGSRAAVASYLLPFTSGTYRGTLYDAMILASDASLKIGDTVTVGSTTWTIMVPNINGPAYTPSNNPNAAYAFNTTAGS